MTHLPGQCHPASLKSENLLDLNRISWRKANDIPVPGEVVDPPPMLVTLDVPIISPFVAVGSAFGTVCHIPSSPPVGSTDVRTFSNTVPEADSMTMPGRVTTVDVVFPSITVALVIICTGTDSTTAALTGVGAIGEEAVEGDVSPVAVGTFPG